MGVRTYLGFDGQGQALWTAEADTVAHALAQVDPSEVSGLGRTNLQVVKDNDGYVEDLDGSVVYDSQDDS